MARFFRRGVSKIYFLPTIAAYSAASGVGAGSPTAPEITAGTNLSPEVADIGGFQMSNAPIETPSLNEKFTSHIDGPDEVSDSTLTMYDQDNSVTIRAAIAKGTAGYIVLMPYGNTTTKRCEVWPVKSTGLNDEWTTSSDPARYTAGFVITNPPNQSAVIP